MTGAEGQEEARHSPAYFGHESREDSVVTDGPADEREWLLGESITSQQVYHCAVDPELFAAKLSRTEAFAKKVRLGPALLNRLGDDDRRFGRRGP